MADEYTTGELRRMVGDLTNRLDRIIDRLDKLPDAYVLRGEYVEARRADDRRFKAVETDVEEIRADGREDQKWRRGAMLALALAAVGWLLTIVGLIVAVTVT